MRNFESVKKPYVKEKLTIEDIIELKKCISDPLYFIETHLKIQHPIRGLVPFKLYDYQKEIIRTFVQYDKVILMTARQMGKTSTAAAYILYYAMFNSERTVLIVAQFEKQALEIMYRIKTLYENIDTEHYFLKAGVVSYNKGSIEFDNGSRILSRATSPHASRGLSISLLYMDEFAFVPRNIAEEFWSSVQPTISSGGKIIITSTPNVDDDLFAQLWHQAVRTIDPETGEERDVGINGFKALLYTWDKHPERDEKWAEEQKAILGIEKFERECNCSFIGSDELLISPIVLANLKGKEPIRIEMEGRLKWYEKPIDGHTVYVGLDPSTGTGGDYAALQIFQLQNGKLVQLGEWRDNKADPKKQIEILSKLLKGLQQSLPNSSVLWSFENNALGEAINILIKDVSMDEFPGQLINEPKTALVALRRKKRRGLNTNKKTKIAACMKLKTLLEANKMIIHSKMLISELKGFAKIQSSFSAKPGYTDDLIMALLVIMRIIIIGQRYDDETYETLKENLDEREPLPIEVLF